MIVDDGPYSRRYNEDRRALLLVDCASLLRAISDGVMSLALCPQEASAFDTSDIPRRKPLVTIAFKITLLSNRRTLVHQVTCSIISLQSGMSRTQYIDRSLRGWMSRTQSIHMSLRWVDVKDTLHPQESPMGGCQGHTTFTGVSERDVKDTLHP